MRKAILHCHDEDGSWAEKYEEGDAPSTFKPGDDIEIWAHALLDRWNATLRPKDKPRVLDRVEVVDDGAPAEPPKDHDWHKTNAATLSDRSGVYDRMRCERCGTTGKRFGLTNIKRDAAFKARAFETCRGALALLAKRQSNVAAT